MNDSALQADWIPSETFVLRAIDLFNWGPFGGRHSVDIHPAGTAIIGPTGSGKTTLVDALMTLLVAQPRYNLASTGGHESDRDLISYIRGVSGAGNETGDNRHVARSGRTVTGVSATCTREGQRVEFGALFWLDSGSFANAERRDLWFFSENAEQSLDQWLTLHDEGGARALKQIGRDTPRLRVFDTKRAYLAHLRRFFEVGDNAFTLLNRAAGLKQLNSVDEIFRELVLDDHSAFDRSAEVASEFDNLTAIYRELEVARNQQQTLAPIESLSQQYDATRTEEDRLRRVMTVLPLWFALIAERLWNDRLVRLDSQLHLIAEEIDNATLGLADRQRWVDSCHDKYLTDGGGTIEELKARIESQREVVADRRRNAADYQRLTAALSLPTDLDEATFTSNQTIAAQRITLLTERIGEQQLRLYEIGAIRMQHQDTVDSLHAEITAVRSRPGSNIPIRHQEWRSQLAEAINTPEASLPFVAELIEVKPEFSAWRGAIERAIGGNRVRILVPPDQAQPALHWINERDNRLHVRVLEANPPARPPVFMHDGFVGKLNFKAHALREPMKALLAASDLHCVDSPEALRQTPHAMTVQGLMSAGRDRFDKMDQESLHKGWVTGFDNKDQLASLTEASRIAVEALDATNKRYDAAQKAVEVSRQTQTQLSHLLDLRFTAIDLPAAAQVLEDLNQRLALLSDPDSDSGRAKQAYEAACIGRDEAQQSLQELRERRTALNERRSAAAAQQQRARQRLGDGLTDEDRSLAEASFPALTDADTDHLADRERDARDVCDGKTRAIADQRSHLTQRLVRQMEQAKKVDTGALVESGSAIGDVPAYLARLLVLTEEALPEKLTRFQLYLTQSSDQGVTQLLAEIDSEVSAIEERIEELNHTLRLVDFQDNRFLRLLPKRVTHESLRSLERARNQLRSAVLKDDQGEAHYRALEHLVTILRDANDSKRNLASRALLDPRYRLQFSYAVVDRSTDEVIETRKGSQGGSGGEKEIIASYILTASLSYALCPDGASHPLFGTVILDEAFSKSSQVVAGRIITALKKFGLHPLFVTPNKEMRLLREHTRSAILVHRKAFNATLTSITWEELEAQAQLRRKHVAEISD